MPAAEFSVGRDASLTIATTDQGVLTFGILTDFDSKPMTAEIKVIGLDGIMRPAYLPEGWQGSFEYTRQDSQIDDYFAQLEDNYYSGGDLPSATITETITEIDGSITQYRFENVALKTDDAGKWSGNKEVKMKVDFMASRRRKVI